MSKAKSLALTFLGFLGLPILAAVILLALWLFPQWQLSSKKLSSPDKQAEMENAYRATLVQALGGAFFFFTAYLTWRNLKVAEENLKVTQKKQATDQLVAEANLKVTEEKQVTERFSKAIELLGSKELAVRLGGIYALERIAKDSPKDHWTIMEVLTSFVQEKSPLPSDEPTQDLETILVPKFREQSNSSSQKQELQKITTEVRAAITVIGRRNSTNEQEWQEISLRNINLRGANFRGATLEGADLRGAILEGAHLEGADFRGAKLWKANLRGANLWRAKLIEANLCGANLELATIEGADLEGADLWGANFWRANLTGANCTGANFWRANLTGANCTGANFWRANLTGADLTKADLTKADLSGTNLYEANLCRATNLTPEQIRVAITDKTTKLPDYLQSPKPSQPEPPEP